MLLVDNVRHKLLLDARVQVHALDLELRVSTMDADHVVLEAPLLDQHVTWAVRETEIRRCRALRLRDAEALEAAAAGSDSEGGDQDDPNACLLAMATEHRRKADETAKPQGLEFAEFFEVELRAGCPALVGQVMFEYVPPARVGFKRRRQSLTPPGLVLAAPVLADAMLAGSDSRIFLRRGSAIAVFDPSWRSLGIWPFQKGWSPSLVATRDQDAYFLFPRTPSESRFRLVRHRLSDSGDASDPEVALGSCRGSLLALEVSSQYVYVADKDTFDGVTRVLRWPRSLAGASKSLDLRLADFVAMSCLGSKLFVAREAMTRDDESIFLADGGNRLWAHVPHKIAWLAGVDRLLLGGNAERVTILGQDLTLLATIRHGLPRRPVVFARIPHTLDSDSDPQSGVVPVCWPELALQLQEERRKRVKEDSNF